MSGRRCAWGCVLIALFGRVLCRVDASALAQKDKTVRDVYAAVGSLVEVSCEGVGVQWRLNGSALRSGPALALRNASLGDQGVYTCHSLAGDLLLGLSLQLGYPPSPPEVKCWSPSYPLKAMCSWEPEPESLLPTQYIATYRMGPLSETRLCSAVPGSVRRCVLDGFGLFSNEPHLINVTAVNPLGSATRVLLVTLDDIVKPDPPVHVRVTPGSRGQLSVEWAPPPSWPDPINFALKYRVQHYRGKQEAKRTVTLGPYETVQMTLTRLRPGQTYHIQVSAQDLLDLGESSDWSQPVSATAPAR